MVIFRDYWFSLVSYYEPELLSKVKMYRWQLRIVIGFVCLGFVPICIQLFFLQVINGKENRLLAEENRLRSITLPAPRGQIYDRNGNLLAGNQPVYRKAEDPSLVIDRIAALKLQADVDGKVVIEPVRDYPFGSAVAHLVGYLGSVVMEELNQDQFRFQGYQPSTQIGRSGVEAEYERSLKGHDGSQLVEVNTQGKTKRVVSQLLPSTGKTITLAVDLRLQQVAEQLMKGKKGAVIASDPKTGEILALFSAPSFDPVVLSLGKDQQQIAKTLSDTNQPLYNRAIAGRYPPGSTFKLITASAGLSEDKIGVETKINDPGVIRVGAFSYSNWYWTGYGRTEGDIAVAKALARSTDTFFYKVGELVGERKLIDWAKKFSVDMPYGIDLPGESGGFIGTPEWKQETKGEGWFLGNTYHMAIGQGDVSLTPLGVNQMTSVFANDGKYCVPRVLRIGAENTPYQAECREVGLKPEYLAVIKKGMVMACSSGGTGYPFFAFKPPVACKTGTAETGEKKQTHAWFTAFAPVEDPSIAITVLVENGGEGSAVAGPIAEQLLTVWFASYKK